MSAKPSVATPRWLISALRILTAALGAGHQGIAGALGSPQGSRGAGRIGADLGEVKGGPVVGLGYCRRRRILRQPSCGSPLRAGLSAGCRPSFRSCGRDTGGTPVGAVDEKTIRECIESQERDQDDPGLKIVAPAEPLVGSAAGTALPRLATQHTAFRWRMFRLSGERTISCAE